MSVILVTGAASGLGKIIVERLEQKHIVHGMDTKYGQDVSEPLNAAALTHVGELDVLVNCAGVNRSNWLEAFTEEDWDLVMNTNAKGIYKMSQWALPMLAKSKGTIVNIVSNASHMPMTCSLAYNASKAAAHIMTQQLARELTKKHGITVFGISPNKLSGTEMSKDIEKQVVQTRGWTPEYAKQYQANALLTGEETPPALVAEFLAFLLSSKDRHKFLSGCVIPYGA